MLQDEVQILRQVPLFSRVAPAKLKLLAFTSDRVSYKAGEALFHQGDPGDSAYVILTGKAEILADAPSGQIKVAELGNNTIVGEIAILCDIARTATVKATMPMEALRIRKDIFLKLLADYPEIAIEIMRVLADRLNKTTTELTEARSHAESVH
ncbi:cyclic nucleotide-binding domain-containing protein [Rhizobium sp. KVB221]|uniref:Cyclic nucleotide-binding domain-containing protein n=1 Tax=Rhizobium setariae TaxID=2801340 RepID=A0A936YN74_9HYPH|nr:cyclic nucleotide-binding domain-containing protein [Rhizobium setariae]MBL0373649.1 cyclic nucleotide-binding domain-containing protein [Rhizobium setariae]